MSLPQLYTTLLAGGLVLLAGIVATRAAARFGLPALLLFLALGLVIGEDGLGLHFDDAQLAQNLGTAALALILVEGGLTTRWSDVRPLLTPSALLATVGVAVSVAITAAGAHLLIGMNWQAALLLGAIVSSTDAAAVFSVLRTLPLPRRVSGMLEAESGFNDAPTVILVLLFSTIPLEVHPLEVAGNVLYQLVVGAVIGSVLGWAGARVLHRITLPASGLYPLAMFGLGVVAFAAAGSVGASGFLAAFVSGLVLANSGLPHRASLRSFAEGLGWLAQIGLFVLLGLLITPHELLPEVVPALVVGLVLLLVARPVSVLVALAPFRLPWREQAFVSWAGLRGAVPIVLATFPVVAGVAGSDRVLNVVFVLVAAFTLVQGPGLLRFARRLGLVRADAAREIQVEVAPLDVLDAELLTVSVPAGSQLHYVTLRELRLPEPSAITLIIRAGRSFVPEPATRLTTGDELLIMTTARARTATENRLRAVSRRGRLAHWFGEYGTPD
ncbi:potassium/proton antiporter [Saccharopolyspora gloriosae]|uniref:potassium/proton antiporter n=1 Tax=Saccharopolyspora gloriosae TaxID=455344 RepID=UPI001FB6EE30|nr:potassium/proton antiporter [Saccharopolyspora gloriosae]